MQVLQRDCLPAELAPLLDATRFDGTVAVQARQMIEETSWLLRLADQFDFIKGVVGWVDLQSPAVDEQLHQLRDHRKLVGVRHVIHDEPDPAFMRRPSFLNGLSKLAAFDLTFDLLLFPIHLPTAVTLVRKFPQQRFVLGHIGKPGIAQKRFEPWQTHLKELADYENVWCKLSGMVTEADWHSWQPKDLHPYLDIVLESFGAGRLMIGSDWPVCTLAGPYETVMGVVIEYIKALSLEEQNAILGENCKRFYKLEQEL
jgi:L-fuconolactonase